MPMPDPAPIRTIDLDAIRCDPLLQPRAGGADLDAAHVADLRVLLKGAKRWPAGLEPLDVFTLSDRKPPGVYWLTGGHYRLAALAAEGWLTARCRVHAGTWKDAFLFSRGENRGHGLKRTPADVKPAAFQAFEPRRGWGAAWVTDAALAAALYISPTRVSDFRHEWEAIVYAEEGPQHRPGRSRPGPPVPAPDLAAAQTHGRELASEAEELKG